MEAFRENLQNFIEIYTDPGLRLVDFIEIFLLALLMYHIIVWVRKSQGWMLLQGLVIIGFFVLIAYFLNMHVVMWILTHSINILVIALVIVFQPELRRGLDSLGRRNIIKGLFTFSEDKMVTEKFSNRTVNEIIKAAREMSRNMTGALIVLEQETPLGDYERTGIRLDAEVSSQLLVNIFEHNTPLHDGAVLLRQDRIVAATCYLPLSENLELSKALGTRHRAGLGLSEVTDALVVIVSEETGRISVAKDGNLETAVTEEFLRNRLEESQQKVGEAKRRKLWKTSGKS